MRIELDQTRLFRDAERARIARWFGEGLVEPVFYSSRGPLPVCARMRDSWLAEADRIIERQAVHLCWMGFEAIAMGIVLVAAMTIAAGLVGDAAPVLRRIPAPLAAAPALSWPLICELRYRLRLRAWRRAIEDRLCVRDRVDAKFAPAGRKYNLFSGAALLLAVLIVGWGLTAALRPVEQFDPLPMTAAAAVAWALHFAGRRIDRNQRRHRDAANEA